METPGMGGGDRGAPHDVAGVAKRGPEREDRGGGARPTVEKKRKGMVGASGAWRGKGRGKGGGRSLRGFL